MAQRQRLKVFTLSAMAEQNLTPPDYTGTEDPGFFIPPDVDGRVTAQGSVFSIGSDPFSPVQTCPEVLIALGKNKEIFRELSILGISEASLFPDIDGIARWLTLDSRSWGARFGVKG